MINTIVTENTHTNISNRSFSSKTNTQRLHSQKLTSLTPIHTDTLTQTHSHKHTHIHKHTSIIKKKCYYKTLSTIEQFVHLVPTLIFILISLKITRFLK